MAYIEPNSNRGSSDRNSKGTILIFNKILWKKGILQEREKIL